MTLAVYKFKVGMDEVVEAPVPGTERADDGTAREPDRDAWSGCLCVVLAHTAEEALEVAVAYSLDPRYDERWLRAVTPERIEINSPQGIALMRV